MIRVCHLTKRFAGCLAVNDISFEVAPGEIVGFLGPNGAGKTTTLRILACYLPATSGSAQVAGYDVFRDSLEVRRRIGYLPESVPLYPEMRVDEYLHFRARLKGVPAAACRRRVREVKECCGLREEGRRIIGQLSKGYRQRVGLADCLVHDPELLILDEPTIGLDPNQVREVRELIRNLAERHTILLSTHFLSEAEMICSRVLIIHQGRLVASDTPEQLRSQIRGVGRLFVEAAGPHDEMIRALRALEGVWQATAERAGDWSTIHLECAPEVDLRADVFKLAARQGWLLRELRREKTSLEDVFVSLTSSGNGEGAP